MIITDPIYNTIKLPDDIKPLINHPYLQRLRRIKQLGTVSLVYPSANHTRFEHSLGVSYLSGIMARSLKLEELKYQIAGLLHDIGHGPYSHQSEEVLREKTNLTHEDISKEKIREMKDIISELGYDYKEIIKEIIGNGSGIVAGSLDSDRLDYLQRDAYFTGNYIGINNIYYLIDNIKLHNNEIVIKEKAIPLVETILMGRIMMFKTVYLHKTTVAADFIVKNIINELLDYYSAREIYLMDDYEFYRAAENIDSKNIEKLKNRELPKLIYKTPIKDFENYNEVYVSLLEELKGRFGDMIYIWPKFIKRSGSYRKIKIITKDGNIKSFYSVSRLYNTLKRLELSLYEIRVYVDRDKIKNVNTDYIKKIVDSLFDT